VRDLPPTSELFTGPQLSQRHPTLLPQNRLKWAARNRVKNGLSAAGAVFESPVGELLFHEPTTLRWLLGLTGRGKPRRSRHKHDVNRPVSP
jgi:hypothetical protein